MKKILLLPVFFLAHFLPVLSQPVPPYKNPQLPVEERVKDLLSRMTPEEKFWQLFMIPGDLDHADSTQYQNGIFGLQVSASGQNGGAAGQMLHYGSSEDARAMAARINAIQHFFVEKTRLGIPIIAFDEAVHGLVRKGATVFPQAIGLAATWDTCLMRRVATAIAREAKARGIRQVLSPVINIASDVRWGRVEETYGEDPFLSSEMGVNFVRPFEQTGIITTPKHFIANVGDGGRDSYPIHYSRRFLDEYYFPPFKACIERGGSRSIMTAYNSLNDIPCSANSWLLLKKLKGDWGFKGFVISDASAVGGATVLHYTAKDYPASGREAVNNGLDVIFQTAYDHYKLFIRPFLDSGIHKARIDDAVASVLRAKFELGLFDHPYVSPKDTLSAADGQAHRTLAREAAIKSFVLLKNERHLLPLSKNIRSIAVIGTDAVEARLGGYSGPGNGKVTILEGIRKRAGAAIPVYYAPGCGRISEEWTVVPSRYLSSQNEGKPVEGLQGTYYDNITLSGNPVVTRTDKGIHFQWTLHGPDKAIPKDFYSARWTGTIRCPETGTFKIGLDGDDGFRLYLDNKLVIDNWKKQTYSTRLTDFHFEKGKACPIRVEFFEPVGNAHIRLIWNAGVTNDWQAKIREAVATARKADVALVVAGIEEGEFRDRAFLGLPGHQEALIKAVAAAGKPVVVLLVGGSAITMHPWLSKAGAVLDLWYPGVEGGHAVADVLFGDADPAGRLPITFPIAEAQLPLIYDHEPTGRGDDYNNLSGLPLFPFGFGLSYTQFSYRDLRFDKNTIGPGDSTVVRFTLKNTGSREGDEVVQLYIHDELASVAQPVIALKGFQRIHLLAGQEKEVAFTITPSLLSLLNEQLKTVEEPGDFRIMIGASSRDLRLKGTLHLR